MRDSTGAETASHRIRRRQRAFGAALLTLALLLLAAPAAQAGKALIGTIGTPKGEGAGQLGARGEGEPMGIAVNRTGAGGVGAGDLYVVDSGNSRIEEFSATGAFVRAFGYDVVASGPDNTGANEKQALTVDASGGSFAIKLLRMTIATTTAGSNLVSNLQAPTSAFHVGDTVESSGVPAGTTITAVGADTITLSASAGAEASSGREFKALENTGATATGNLTEGSKEVTGLKTTSGAFTVGERISGTGIPAGTTIEALGAGTLTLSAAVEAGKTSTEPVKLTATNLSHDISAAALQAALEALPMIGAGNVVVSGGPGASAPLTIEYKGAFAHNVAAETAGRGDPSNLITPLSAGLSGATHTATLATTTPGGGYEVCSASSPTDACKSGPYCNQSESGPEACLEAWAPGSMNKPNGIAVDQASGNVYVLDTSQEEPSNRVDVYSAKGVPEGAFGYDVIPSGASGTGTLSAGSRTVASLATTSKAFAPGQAITGTGIPPGTTIAALGENTITLSQAATASGSQALSAPAGPGNLPGNETQTVTVAKATGGTFNLSFRTPNPSPTNQTTTANIPFNASAAEVQAALEALTNIGAGNVAVSGAGPYSVEFKGTRFADTNVAALEAAAGSPVLKGLNAGVTVTTAREGGSFEFCTAATGCQKGSRGSPGASSSGQPAIDPANGHLYVPDGGNARVEEFAPAVGPGKEVTGISFVRAFGYDVVASGPDNVTPVTETQTLEIPATVTGGTFTLTFDGQTTSQLPFNVTTSNLQNSLFVLKSVEGVEGFIEAKAKGAGKWQLVFRSHLENQPVPQITADSSQLIGGEATTSTLAQGVSSYERCIAGSGDVCKAGLSDSHLGQFCEGDPSSLAVDSTGAIYALSSHYGRCGAGFGIGRVAKFDPAASAAEEFAPALLTQPELNSPLVATDVAVDPADDHVLVAREEGFKNVKFLEFDSSGTLLDKFPGGEAVLQGFTAGGLAVGGGGRFYYSNGSTGAVNVFGPPPAPTVSIAPVTGVGTTSATFHGTVTPPAPIGIQGLDTTYHFEYSSDEGASWTPFPAPDADAGDGTGAGSPSECPANNPPSCEVTQTVTNLVPGSAYEVRLVASTGTEAISSTVPFATEAGVPSISEMLAEEIAETSVTITGLINPNNDSTVYHFEWGADESYGNRVPVASDANAGSGSKAVKVSAELTGLKAATVYHFRLVASNSAGTAKGPDHEFSTLDPFGLPYGRAPEQVSPNDKRPTGLTELFGNPYQASSDGNSVVFPLMNGLADATAGGSIYYLGTRTAAGWAPAQLTPPALIPAIGDRLSGNSTGRVLYSSADLSCQLLESPEPLGEMTPELEDDVEKSVINLYRRNPNGTYTLLNPQPLNFAERSGYHTDWATADCSHILFDSGYRLLAGALSVAGTGELLYEWANGTLRLAGIRPDGSVAGEAVAGQGEVHPAPGDGGQYTNLNSLSANGSRVFFTANSDEGPDKGEEALFVRKDATETLDLSQSETATVDLGSHYLMATPTGSKVFFLANYGLATNGSSAGATSCDSGGAGASSGSGCDLYEYDLESETLSDLSADPNPADQKGASVVGTLDASDDGSYVYFAARGQLVPKKGKTEAQNLAGSGSYNVYERHNGALSYVGLISQAETGRHSPSGGDLTYVFTNWVADATPDGSHLLFASKANVTGYESGGVADAYLYSASDGKTVCVSCRSDGQKSIGNGETEPLKAWQPHGDTAVTGTQHRPRSISDDGRHVFFTMPDVLAAGARAGAKNVYEWSGGQVYLLAAGEGGAATKDFTEYQDSSASGSDVFLVTKAKLVPQDFDNTTDLYDLRVPHVAGEKVGPEAVKPLPIPCDPLAGACEEAPTPQPGTGPAAGSEGFAGPGNPPAAAPKRPPSHKHKHKHKHKGRKHKRHQHRGRARR